MKSRCLLRSRHRLFTYQAYVQEIDKESNRINNPRIGLADSNTRPQTNPSISSSDGIGDLEGVPDTRSGGSVLEAPPGAEEGALPRKREPVQPLKQLAHGSHSPASVVRYALSQTLAHGSLTPPQAASGMPSLSNPYRVTGTLENSRTVPSGSPERTSASPMRTASALAPA